MAKKKEGAAEPQRSGLTGMDLYLKHTDKNGATSIRYHRTWDMKDCYRHQLADAMKEGGTVELSTEEDYDAARRPRSAA